MNNLNYSEFNAKLLEVVKNYGAISGITNVSNEIVYNELAPPFIALYVAPMVSNDSEGELFAFRKLNVVIGIIIGTEGIYSDAAEAKNGVMAFCGGLLEYLNGCSLAFDSLQGIEFYDEQNKELNVIDPTKPLVYMILTAQIKAY